MALSPHTRPAPDSRRRFVDPEDLPWRCGDSTATEGIASSALVGVAQAPTAGRCARDGSDSGGGDARRALPGTRGAR